MNSIYALREVDQTRMESTYDGTEITEVRDARLIEIFMTRKPNSLDCIPIGVLLRIRTKGYRFNLAALLEITEEKMVWTINHPKLRISDEEYMILQDYIDHVLNELSSSKGLKVETIYKETGNLS